MTPPPSSLDRVPEFRAITEAEVAGAWLDAPTTDDIGFERPTARAVVSIFWIVVFGVGGIVGVAIPVVYGDRYGEVAALGFLSFCASGVAVWWWKRFVHRGRITGVTVRTTTTTLTPGGSFDVVIAGASGRHLAVGIVVEEFRIWGFLERPDRSRRRDRKFLVKCFDDEMLGEGPIRVRLGDGHPVDVSEKRHQIATHLRLVPANETERFHIGSMRTKLDVRIPVRPHDG